MSRCKMFKEEIMRFIDESPDLRKNYMLDPIFHATCKQIIIDSTHKYIDDVDLLDEASLKRKGIDLKSRVYEGVKDIVTKIGQAYLKYYGKDLFLEDNKENVEYH